MTKKNLTVVLVVVGLVTALIGFWGGTYYQKNQQSTDFVGQMNGQQDTDSSSQQMTRNQAGGLVSGEITSISESSITIKTEDGSSKLVVYSDSTTISKTAEVSIDDLEVGDEANIMGDEDSDGIVTAQTIIVGGSFNATMGGENMPGGGPAGQPNKE